MSRASLPSCTDCVRRLPPSLSNSRLECVFTVFSLTNSRAAISRLLSPGGDQTRISSSRGVMPSSFIRLLSAAVDGPPPCASCRGNLRLLSRQRDPEPDAQPGEEHSHQAAVNCHRMYDYQETVLG